MLVHLGDHHELVCMVVILFQKQMKEMKHENLVQFFGVCTEPPNTCLVMQYCRKGSLKVHTQTHQHTQT